MGSVCYRISIDESGNKEDMVNTHQMRIYQIDVVYAKKVVQELGRRAGTNPKYHTFFIIWESCRNQYEVEVVKLRKYTDQINTMSLHEVITIAHTRRHEDSFRLGSIFVRHHLWQSNGVIEIMKSQ